MVRLAGKPSTASSSTRTPGEPDYLGCIAGNVSVGRGHRATADLGLRHRRSPPERLHARLRRHRPADAQVQSPDQVLAKITLATAVFVTHILGLHRKADPRANWELASRKIPLIEDVCESHGATMQDKRLGSFGLMSHLLLHYAHHLSTILVAAWYAQTTAGSMRRFACSARTAWCGSVAARSSRRPTTSGPDLNPDFIFAYPALSLFTTSVPPRSPRGHRTCRR